MALRLTFEDKFGITHNLAYARIYKFTILNPVDSENKPIVIIDLEIYSSQEARNFNKLPVETLTFNLEINKTDISTTSISSSYNYVKTLDLFKNSTDC
jgi:hypothetical protein